MRETGTEMSCLMLAPSGFCDSEIPSRRRQSAAAWAGVLARAASSISPASTASARACSAVARSQVRSNSTYQGEGRASGSLVPGQVAGDELQRPPADQLEGQHGVVGGLADQRQQGDRRLDAGHGGEHGLDLAVAGKQLEDGGGDDPQRPLGSQEQVLEIVAGVVLAQGPQPVPELAVGA